MKKVNLLIFIFIIAFITSCSNIEIEPPESFAEGWIEVNDSIQVDGLIMVNDDIYVYTGYKVPEDIDKNAVFGKITSVVDYLERPTENGQANFKMKGAKYAQYEDDIVVQIYDEWILFKKEKDIISGFSVKNFSFLMNHLTDEEVFKIFRTIRKYIIVDKDYETNLETIIEKSFNECGIYDPSIIDYAISNLEITVSGPKNK